MSGNEESTRHDDRRDSDRSEADGPPPDGARPGDHRRRRHGRPRLSDDPVPVAPWYLRIRPSLERTVATFAAAGVGTGLLGAIGALLLTEGGAGEYGDFVVAWAFGLIGIIAVGFFGTGLAAVTGVRTAQSVRGRAAYAAGGIGGFAGQVVLVGIAAVGIGATTQVALTGTIAVLAVVSGIPAAVAGVTGTVVGRRFPAPTRRRRGARG